MGNGMRNSKAKTPRLSRRGARILTREASSLPARISKAAPGFKKILVALDFSDLSLQALKEAKLFAEEFSASIHVVTVMERPMFLSGFENFPQLMADVHSGSRTRARLERLLALELPSSISSTIDLRWGNPANEILQLAHDRNVDLILLGSHGPTGLKHLLLGNTAGNVVRRAPCPVLVVPPPKGKD